MWLLFLILIISATYLLVKRQYSYWQRRGFPYEEPRIPLGVLGPVWRRQRSLGMAVYDSHRKSKEKYVGIYLAFRPALLIRDAELARNILTKDFANFHDRGVYVEEDENPLSASLFTLQGKSWKTSRVKLTPSFTSGKLKAMFVTSDDVGNKMIQYLKHVIPENGYSLIDMKELVSTFAIDIVGSVIFGLEINSFEDPNNGFRSISRKFNEPTIKNLFQGTSDFLFPPLMKLLHRLGFKDEVKLFLKNLVQQTIEYREKNNVSRKDMMQLLIQLRNTGKVNVDDNEWDVKMAADGLKTMSIDKIAAQAYLFHVAGFEPTASAAAYTIFELSQNSNLLARVQKDIQECLSKHGGFCYEAIQDMKLLDLCIMETTRKYSALPILNRECTQQYEIPGTNKIIEKGTPILISLFGIHRDPEYFPDPLKYDPERFLESTKNYDPVAYMPFGEGPRHCIAQRMGQVNAKLAIAKLLTNFDLEISKKNEIEFDTFGVPIMPKGGVNVKICKLKG